MTLGRFRWLVLVGALVLTARIGGQAQGNHDPFDAHHDDHHDDYRLRLNGIINDHTIATAGAWELHGVWTLGLKEHSGKADFTAALTMERSDYWFLTNADPPADPNSVTARNPHTHHVSLADGAVTDIAGGFRVSGPAILTGNGATPPFGTSSTAQVDITGGDLVAYANIALTFAGDAVKHFGAEPFSGVVTGIR